MLKSNLSAEVNLLTVELNKVSIVMFEADVNKCQTGKILKRAVHS